MRYYDKSDDKPKKISNGSTGDIIYMIVVQHRTAYAIVNTLQLFLVYFYFSRYIVPNRDVPASAYMSAAFFIFLNVDKIILLFLKISRWFPCCSRCAVLDEVRDHSVLAVSLKVIRCFSYQQPTAL